MNEYNNKRINKAVESIKNSTAEKDDPTIKISIAKEKRNLKPLNGFVMLFYENFEHLLINKALKGSEVAILTILINQMAYGNQLAIKQSGIARKLGVSAPYVSKVFKKFKQIGIILEDEDGVYLNPQIVAKGKLWDHKENIDRYNKSVLISEQNGLSKSF